LHTPPLPCRRPSRGLRTPPEALSRNPAKGVGPSTAQPRLQSKVPTPAAARRQKSPHLGAPRGALRRTDLGRVRGLVTDGGRVRAPSLSREREHSAPEAYPGGQVGSPLSKGEWARGPPPCKGGGPRRCEAQWVSMRCIKFRATKTDARRNSLPRRTPCHVGTIGSCHVGTRPTCHVGAQKQGSKKAKKQHASLGLRSHFASEAPSVAFRARLALPPSHHPARWTSQRKSWTPW